jgi:hypothetical protein
VIGNNLGPPERDEPGPTPETGPNQKSVDTTTNQPNLTVQPRQCGFDTVAGLHRRRYASQRSIPLACGCPDPWTCRCTDPPLSDYAVDGWRNAVEHVLATGQTPILPIEVLQRLWRNGGADRELAARVWEQTGGLVA